MKGAGKSLESKQYNQLTESDYLSRRTAILAIMELLAKFDSIMQEHVRRITNNQLPNHYLSNRIQNELIILMSRKIQTEIIYCLKVAKYFVPILDCTPDFAHKEQMTVVVRFVETSESFATIKKYILDFLVAEDQTGKQITKLFTTFLTKNSINIDDCREQGYDNRSNMKGCIKRVQTRIPEHNLLSFFSPCGAH
ncbi:uncharacterized protein LOC124817974 [Hydra vulgaris]|uniref:uncharacterized protein LOC124817974 n=1 Tax=Hydra vulgaris TaxID=6087 RepID=UPI001F5F5CDC|nr:uncharacterized protein LOC124817974 [Hydra vulgaris]